MKTGVRLFVSSMVFAAIIDVLYAFCTHDIVGSVLLGMLTLALLVIAIYITVAERDADLAADDASLTPDRSAGETIGVFALESYWPPVLALAVVLVALGLTFLPGFSGAILAFGILLAAWALRFMVREST